MNCVQNHGTAASTFQYKRKSAKKQADFKLKEELGGSSVKYGKNIRNIDRKEEICYKEFDSFFGEFI